MKIKEVQGCGIAVSNGTNIGRYLANFAAVKPVEINVIAKVDGETEHYAFFCEDRKVGAEVLKSVKEDLKAGQTKFNLKAYEEFIWDCIDEEAIISVYDFYLKKGGCHKVKTLGINVPF